MNFDPYNHLADAAGLVAHKFTNHMNQPQSAQAGLNIVVMVGEHRYVTLLDEVRRHIMDNYPWMVDSISTVTHTDECHAMIPNSVPTLMLNFELDEDDEPDQECYAARFSLDASSAVFDDLPEGFTTSKRSITFNSLVTFSDAVCQVAQVMYLLTRLFPAPIEEHAN